MIQISLNVAHNYRDCFNFIKRENSYTLLLRQALNWVLHPRLRGSPATKKECFRKNSKMNAITYFEIKYHIKVMWYTNITVMQNIPVLHATLLSLYFRKDIISFDISFGISFCTIFRVPTGQQWVIQQLGGKNSYPTWSKAFFHFCLVSLCTGKSMLLIRGILKHWKRDEVMCKTIPMVWSSGYTKNKLQNLLFYNKLS